MRFEDEDLERIRKNNAIMKAINDSTDDIYESLMDEEYSDMVKHLQKLTTILRKLIKKYKD
tara:strand:- start:255 stop:437 length:183 start_codon:yes stop_codon:yes gene_type:complete